MRRSGRALPVIGSELNRRLLFPCLLCLCAPLAADTVRMRDGRVFSNVVSVPTQNGYFVVASNGRVHRLRGDDVLTLRVAGVRWPRGLSRQQVEALVEQRIAEYVRKEGPARRPALPGPDPKGARAVQAGPTPFSPRAFVPGWQRWQRGDDVRAAWQVGATLASVWAALRWNRALHLANRDFDRAVLVAAVGSLGSDTAVVSSFVALDAGARAEERMRQASRRLDVTLLFFGTFYAWTVFDGYSAGSGPVATTVIGADAIHFGVRWVL